MTRETQLGFQPPSLGEEEIEAVAETLRSGWLTTGPRAALLEEPGPPYLSDFDVHAWDWLWAVHVKLRRPGQEWLVYVELVKFVETMLLTGFGVLARDPWRGVLRLEERLPPGERAEAFQATVSANC